MSTTVISLSDNRSNSSQGREQSTAEENEYGRTEMLRELCETSDVPKDRRNLIAFFCFGVCNAFLFYLGAGYETIVRYHTGLFFASIPIGIIKVSPMFITAFIK